MWKAKETHFLKNMSGGNSGCTTQELDVEIQTSSVVFIQKQEVVNGVNKMIMFKILVFLFKFNDLFEDGVGKFLFFFFSKLKLAVSHINNAHIPFLTPWNENLPIHKLWTTAIIFPWLQVPSVYYNFIAYFNVCM